MRLYSLLAGCGLLLTHPGLTADALVICIGPEDAAARPVGFETKAKDGLILLEFRKRKGGR